MAGFGSVGSMESVRKENTRLRSSVKNYRKPKNHYIGTGNENTNANMIPKLSTEELQAGRKRAMEYINKRNRTNRIMVVCVVFFTCILLYLAYISLIELTAQQDLFRLELSK